MSSKIITSDLQKEKTSDALESESKIKSYWHIITPDGKIENVENFDFSKKILYHPEKITAYKEGQRPFPTTIEVDLTNRCNHRCSFCYYAEHIGVEADKPSLDTDLLKDRLVEAKKLGAKYVISKFLINNNDLEIACYECNNSNQIFLYKIL